MKQFTYRAYDASGVLKQGEIASVSAESARFKLKASGLIPVRITDAENSFAPSISDRFSFHLKPRSEEIEEFTSRMSILLKNGIKVDKAIAYAEKGVVNPKLKAAVAHIHDSIRKGAKLSDTLKSYPALFDTLYVSMVRVGEESGHLDRSFSDIAATLKFQRTISSKTKQALIYPLILFLVCTGSILFIFNFVVPRFSSIFNSSADLPFYTTLLIDISHFFQTYQLVLFLGALLFMAGIYVIRDHPRVKAAVNRIFVSLPMVRQMTYTRENLRFASTLATLLANKVLLADALEHAVESVSNTFIKKKLLFVKKRVRSGEKLSRVLTDTGLMPDVFEGLVEVGEQTGNLAEVFKEMQERLKADYENRINALMTFIEPVMIVVMGAIVGSVVVGLLMSMVSINDMVF
jgi:type II secretory pathway component PulF